MGTRPSSRAAGESGPVGRTVVRLLLLIVLATGVAGMHTVGHPHEAVAAPADISAAEKQAAHPADPAMGGPALDRETGCPQGHCPPPDHHGSGHGTNPMSLCLAVLLVGLGMALAALAAAAARRRPGPGRLRAGSSRCAAGRSPPRPPEPILLQVLRI
ncbi:MAG TPA: DUF6153 family protein [Yinghuangia sp.]|nr:DUF6153 family protein [Yinghuangia sp.]